MKIIKSPLLKIIFFSIFSFGFLFNSLVTSNSSTKEGSSLGNELYLKQDGKICLFILRVGGTLRDWKKAVANKHSYVRKHRK